MFEEHEHLPREELIGFEKHEYAALVFLAIAFVVALASGL